MEAAPALAVSTRLTMQTVESPDPGGTPFLSDGYEPFFVRYWVIFFIKSREAKSYPVNKHAATSLDGISFIRIESM